MKPMNRAASLFSVFVLTLILTSAIPVSSSAGDRDGDKDSDKDKEHVHRPPRETCFNVFCSYTREGAHGGAEKCEAGAVFRKLVEDDGDEFRDNSATPFNPSFEVQCDGQVIFNNSAHRFTDHLGTRIQAETGPYPAIVLPRGALRDGHRYEASALELGSQFLEGYCYIYTGPQ